MSRRLFTSLLIFFFALVFCSSCSTSPKLIASEPVRSLAIYPKQSINYSAEIELDVWNIQTTIDQAILLVNNQGGYLEDFEKKDFWGKSYARLDFEVPDNHLQYVFRELKELGTFTQGSIINDQDRLELDRHLSGFSHLTLYLYQKSSWEPKMYSPGWNPMHTLQKAWNVSYGLLKFLLDLVIWITVLAGPIFLIGWLVFMAVKRLKTNR